MPHFFYRWRILQELAGFKIKVKCPLCKSITEVFVPKDDLINCPGGILRIPIEHDTPEHHILVLDIDPNGFVRGSYIIRKYYAEEKIPVLDIITIIGIDNLSKLIGWGLSHDKLFVYGEDIDIARWTKTFIALIFRPKTKLATSESEAKVILNIFNVKPPKFNVDLIKSRVKMAARMRQNKSVISFLRHEVSRYVKYLDLFEEIITKTKKKLSLNDLIAKTKNELNKREVKFLLAILKSKGINVTDKVSVTEIKIAELF